MSCLDNCRYQLYAEFKFHREILREQSYHMVVLSFIVNIFNINQKICLRTKCRVLQYHLLYNVIRQEEKDMNWINGMQTAIDYIEEHLTEEIDYAEVAKQAYSSTYHFQRVFSALCGYTLGEYIRNRRLTLAGIELSQEKAKVIDVAIKYGYESPDSFAKAFHRFHGIIPSQARSEGVMLKSFSRLSLKFRLEGGSVMNYRIEEKPAMILTGYKRRFSGSPAEREEQEAELFVSTRANQYILKGISGDCDTQYAVMRGFSDEGYDFYIASKLDDFSTNHLDLVLGEEDAKRFEKIDLQGGLYLVCETERTQYPTMQIEELRKKAVSEWIASSEYDLAEAPEIAVYHWYYKCGDEKVNSSRYIELWLPISKR